MKKVLKKLTIIFLILFAFIVLLFFVAKVKENEIAVIVLEKIEESTHIPITINDISLNLIRRFPLATIALEGVNISSPDTVSLADTLISDKESLVKIEKTFVSVRLRPLFKGEFEIKKVEIKGVDFKYVVDKQGKSNFDFLMDTSQTASPDTSPVNLKVMLKELVLRDVHCYYDDSLNVINAQLIIPKVEISGRIKNEYLVGAIKGELRLSDCNYKTTKLHLMKEMEIDLDLAYKQDSVDIKELVVSIDGADLSVLGSMVIKDTIETDIRIQGKKMKIGELVKYLPDETQAAIGLEKASGNLAINASVKGFIADSVLPVVKMNVGMKKGSVQLKDYPLIKNISFSAYLTNGKGRNNKTTSLTINKFHAETPQSSVDMTVSLNNLDQIRYKINSECKIELGEFKKYLPDSLIADARGQIQAGLSTKGVMPDSIGKDYIDYILETSQLELTMNNLFIETDSTLSLDSLSGHLAYDLHHITLRDLHVSIPKYKLNVSNTSFDAVLSGKISELSKAGIDLKSFQIKTDNSAIYGSAKIQDMEAPEFNFTSELKLTLGEFKPILGTQVKNLSGEITAQIASKGKLNPDSIPEQIQYLIFENSSFSMQFDRVSVDLPDTLMCVKDFSGNMDMNSDTININNTSGVYKGIDFSIDSTKIANLYKAFIKKQDSQLNVEGRFNLGDLDYSMFAPFLAGNADTIETPAENTDTVVTAKDTVSAAKKFSMLVKGKFGIRSVTYKKAFIENISGLFKITDSLYLVDQFKFDGFGGKLNTSVRYEIRKGDDNMLWVKNNIEKMNVSQLLKDFDNFKDFYQPAITYENLSGILSTMIDAQIYRKGDSLIRNKMYVKGDIKLEKGGIFNFQPLKDMEQHLKTIGNLDTLEFKTINSNLFVFQDAVYVPTTLIISNKLDATALGMQSFGEDYSYHFIVFIRDILTEKNQRLNEKQDKIGEEISSTGRKGTLIKSYSIDGKSRSGLDSKDNQEKMRSQVKASEGLLKVRFHPNIVNYNTGLK